MPELAAAPSLFHLPGPGRLGRRTGLLPPTPVVDGRIDAAERLLRDGEAESARQQLNQLIHDASPPVAARAQIILARSLLASRDDEAARQAFQAYLARFPQEADAPLAAFALGHLAFTHDQTGLAAEYLQRYLSTTSDHALDGEALWDLAQISQKNGQASEAISLLQRAVEAGLPLPRELKAASDVAVAFERAGDFGAAAEWYASLAARPSNDPATRARYQVLEATDLLQAGRTRDAVALLRPLLAEGTLDTQVGFVLDALQRAGDPVSDFEAGEAYLLAHQYDRAVALLGDYLDREPSGANAATARFDRGRALLGQNSDAAAAAQFDRFVQTAPNDPRIGQATLLEGEALQRSGSTTQAVWLLQSFAAQHPTDPSAPRALANAVQYLRQDSQTDAAQRLEQQLIAAFPGSPFAAQAAFDLGWAAYERLDFATARTFWQMVRDRWANVPTSAPALLWLGKLEQRAGNLAAARHDYELAWKANPGDYYAFRARDLAESLGSSLPPSEIRAPSADQLAHERADFESWLASWTHPGADERARPYLGAAISRDSTLARLRALADLGFQEEVDAEVASASNRFRQDGRSLYALADTLARAGLTRASLAAAYQLLMISPAPNAYQAPIYLQRLVYPFPYQDLIVPAARTYGVDPLLLVALIRQESSFNTTARSPSNAIGLTQFMPSTAQAVATEIGLADFRLDDLFRPAVAIRLGAAYLATEIKAFGGHPFIALAAYNAGEGNVRGWLVDNPRRDLDLLVEEIPFSETREYVRNIYRFYQEYRSLYHLDTTP